MEPEPDAASQAMDEMSSNMSLSASVRDAVKLYASKVTKQNVIYSYVDVVMPGTPLCRTLEKQFAMQGVKYRMLTTRVSVPHHCVH